MIKCRIKTKLKIVRKKIKNRMHKKSKIASNQAKGALYFN